MEQKDQIDKVDFNHSTLYWGGPSQGIYLADFAAQ